MGDLMAERTCFNCVYCVCDPCLWLRWLDVGESIVPQCANHPQWPGWLHDVPGVPCRNYRPKPAVPQGDGVRMIPLGGGGYAYVDAADYEWLNQYHWSLDNGYAARNEKGKTIFMHRQIMQPPKGMVVDHVDSNQTNNCRANLRTATRAQNRANQRRRHDSSSRFKGVFYNRSVRRWYAKCMYARRTHCSAYFDTDVEAAQAYDHLAVAWFGEFARLNFPREWPPERRAQVYAENQPQREEAERSKKAKERKRGEARGTRGGRKTVLAPTHAPLAAGHSRRAKVKRKTGKSSREGAKEKRKKQRRETPKSTRTQHGLRGFRIGRPD